MSSPVDCPVPDNMAAIALQMQETAMQAEAELYAAELAFAASLNRPTWVVDLTTTVSGIAANAHYDLFSSGGGTYVEQFNNTGFEVKESGLIRLPYAGLWEVGMCINQTASGAVNDNTVRDFIIVHARQSAASPVGYTELWRESSTLMESNTGVGTDATVIMDVDAQARDILKVFLYHGNTSSTMTVPNSPTPRFWGSLRTSRDQVKVV